MSATVDANVLIYATNRSDPAHPAAAALVADLAAGPDLFFLFWPTLFAYLRIVTHAGILPHPLSPQQAMANVEALLSLDHVRTPAEGDGFWTLYRATAGGDTRGNLVPDAHLVGLMRQHGVRLIYTRDRDFRRFDGVTAVDPFGD